MATQTIKMIFQFRRAHTNEWLEHKDIVPAAGEPCFDLDLNILKIGDGVKTYEKLEPISGAKLSADGKSIILTDGVFKLMGFDAAEIGAQPRKGVNNEIEWFVPSTKEMDDVKADVKTLKYDVEGLNLDVTNLKADSTSMLGKIEGLEAKIGASDDTVDAKIDAKINEFANKVSADGTVNTIKELIDYVANHGSEFNTLVNDVTTLRELVGSKSVHEQIVAATDSKVDKVDGMGLSTNDFTDSLFNKLTAIEENAQVNIIEKINVGGSILDVVEKSVNIPVAGIDRAGVVKSSTGANKVNISNSGEMSVNKVSVHSIFVPIGDELILDGGGVSNLAHTYPTRIGNIGYNNISDAVSCADNGDVITLQEDVNMGANDNDHLVVKAENVTIDLGGKVLTANGSSGAIKVEGGMTTLDGAGTVSGTLGSDKYSMAVWANNGTVVINDGVYRNETDGSVRGTDLIYASGTGCIEINGGVFEAAKPEWTLNCKDSDYKAGTAKIVVKGGSFKGFDPANNKSEGAGTNFVAEGYKSVLEGEYYVVKPI